ncbi:thioredoxin domain-containing protein 3-like [Linepithema humile]|uniref:thioredoxin domain-containing protein 3-like n=1 Tax=Linepithema humile TaxID=83485 RepID=UPI00062388AD|nr:PREDICTED: thioredoxin domain-containing protein 3-like [Linepithema humile]XP_012233294.1 PREDICTED: thioredoxin domain-containing protein 3-like [Linepithema humile]
MAKKVAPAALQTEVINDEEWAKILKRKGLVVVDVYSDWSGPCTGMVSILKKIKMEIGGDALSYATASCDRVTDLKRFQGKSEPTWMFIHEGRMINLMFGAHCPQFMKTLVTELERVQNGGEHEFSLDVFEMSPEEVTRLEIQEEARKAKEIARKSRKEAEAKARYEAEMLHLTTSLCNETCLLLFPWIFKDEEGKRRDKRTSPPYVELIEELLPENYTVEQEIRKRMNDDLLHQILDESTYSFSENAKQLLLDGKCMFMRLKIVEGRKDVDVHSHLCTIVFNQSTLPESEEDLNEDCFAVKHCPAFEVPDKEIKKFPFVWTPLNPRNKAIVFRSIFSVYTNTTYPYEDKMTKVPITVFKYDYTRKNDLKMVLDMFNDDVMDFGIFEYDKPPEAKMIAKNIDVFEMNAEEKTGYEIFVCTVKKVGCEAFLGFAGIGPYHVSENPEKAIEESKLYFPDVTAMEDTQSDDEEKPEELMEENQDTAAT